VIEFDRSFFAALFLIFVPLIGCVLVAWRAKSKSIKRLAVFVFFIWIAAWIFVFWRAPVLR
jgi:hypothetical protein